ncbi:MAG: chromate resistance protein [Candidatus Scalindua rubra]|uniref:Chromate resistance protein n=1 Tax=Candidatus Scalindua rubra TaxID=1872076 RepID=A0A1E3X7Z0_9BACT|nr:MAG: chromate resistance protein [Candidatus Scalindua rubra]
MNGEATLVKVVNIENLKDNDVIKLFHKARDDDYGIIINKCSEFSKKILAARNQGIENQLKLRDELKVIANQLKITKEIDYFKSPLSQKAQNALDICIKNMSQLLNQITTSTNEKINEKEILKKKNFQGKKWVTRKKPHVDRIATAWLIKRFIDPKAKFAFVHEDTTKINGIPFDMFQGEFSHQGDNCTFETMLKRFNLKDKILENISEIVHDIDLKDEKFDRNEAKGIDCILRGLMETFKNDDELIKKGFEVFEVLYASLNKCSPKEPGQG